MRARPTWPGVCAGAGEGAGDGGAYMREAHVTWGVWGGQGIGGR